MSLKRQISFFLLLVCLFQELGCFLDDSEVLCSDSLVLGSLITSVKFPSSLVDLSHTGRSTWNCQQDYHSTSPQFDDVRHHGGGAGMLLGSSKRQRNEGTTLLAVITLWVIVVDEAKLNSTTLYS